ncbi:MAG: hypothetical protein V2A34_02670 [Lentisphaerota bacterium]
MKFHAAMPGCQLLKLPLMLGHFVPWFTLRGGDFPLPKEGRKDLSFMPELEDMRHWRDSRAGYRRTHLAWPEIGVYDSRDPEVMEWQFRSAIKYGFNGFIVNWYGKHSVENIITLHWLRGLQAWNQKHPTQPFLYFLSLDSQMQKATEGKQPVSMREDFEYIRDHLITEAYLLRDDRPVFSVFPYENNCAEWRRNLDAVFGADGADLIWMNGFPGQGETAAYPWVCPDFTTSASVNRYVWPDPDNVGEQFLGQFYRQARERNGSIKYLMAGVWPGFDDQLVSWAWNPVPENPLVRPRVICRETSRGNTMELTWKVYLDHLSKWAAHDPSAAAACPLIQVVTWNDYAEASTVEPARDYGFKPLEQCRAHLHKARLIWKQALR